MIKSIEYLVFQLLVNSITPVKQHRKLVFSFNGDSKTFHPLELKIESDTFRLKTNGIFNIYWYDSIHLEEAIYSIMMEKPEKYELHHDLIKDLLNFDNEDFKSMYLKNYYNDLSNQIEEESTDRLGEIMKEISLINQPFENYVNCFLKMDSGLNQTEIWIEVFGFTPGNFEILAFDGWDGSGKELLIGNGHQIIYLEYEYV